MKSWPKVAALALLLAAMLALLIFQWEPAIGFLPAAGALLMWERNSTMNPATAKGGMKPPPTNWPK